MSSNPLRDSLGRLKFDDFPTFLPNKTPKEILQAGAFGGTYFRPIKSSVEPNVEFGDEVWQEFPQDWFEGLNISTQVTSAVYRPEINKYGVKCGASLQEWETSGWIRPQDPYGWFQWYCRFFQGRRTEDDSRQVSRWLACAGPKGRWKNRLCKLVFQADTNVDDVSISPVIRQTLLHWGFELDQHHFVEWGQAQGAEASSPHYQPARKPAEQQQEQEEDSPSKQDQSTWRKRTKRVASKASNRRS